MRAPDLYIQRFRMLLGALALLPLTASCSDSSAEPADEGEAASEHEGALDVRVVPPPGGPGIVDFQSVELTIPPGEDRQICVFMRSAEEDLYVQQVEQLQGDGGHHAILLGTDLDQPENSWVDCTAAEQMADFTLSLLPLSLPEGYAQRLPANMTMVLQSHYINTTTEPLLVRDVVRLHTVERDTVSTPVGSFATNSFDISVPPRAAGELSFDCEVPWNTDLITVGGHLHELGTGFSLEHVNADGEVELLYEVREWQQGYRDTPPIDSFPGNPVRLEAGDILRTRCAWENTRDEALGWPEEMCSSFGLLAGDFEPFECNVGAPGGSSE